MNAPFQARAGLRDPFTAFVCDDATADMLRPVAVEHGWSPEKVNKGGLRNAVQSLSVSASPNILFVDLSESADPLNDIYELAEVVRNLAIREHEKGLSTGEKQMFTRAKKILASELMYALDKDEDEAEQHLDDLLADSAGVTVSK